MSGTPIDPSYGYSLEELLRITPPVAVSDFADFWRSRRTRTETLRTNPQLSRSRRTQPGWQTYDLTYDSTDGVRIGGWLLVPESGPVSRGMVVGHGYGGRWEPDWRIPARECAALFPCLRGIGRSAMPGVSTDPYYHVLHDVQDRQRYILGGCVEDLWLAVTALLELFPQAQDHIGYMGVSFGGGIGALATPWEPRISRAHLALPTFGHHPLRLTLPCNGSGEALRMFQRQHMFNVTDTLAYYDAACAAAFLKIPVLVTVARRDATVPPPGQFAVHNAVPAGQRRLFVLDEGHSSYPAQASQEEMLFNELQLFFDGL